MVLEGAKLATQAAPVTYSFLKDMVLYLKGKARYIKRLEDNIQKLSAEIGTIDSRKQQIERNLKNSATKEPTGEYRILVKYIEIIKKKYNEFLSKYEKYGGKAVTSLQEIDAPSIINVLTALQKRKQTVWTWKFCKLATLSKRVLELFEYVATENAKFNEKYMIMDKQRTNQMKHKTIYDVPQFDEYVDEIMSQLNSADVETIGVVGLIGVGKTTILNLLNNKLVASANETEIVMWIDYEKMDTEDKTIGTIQDQIMLNLKIDHEKTTNINENGKRISTYLCQKKYTFLMDQVSSKIDLQKVGIQTHKLGRVVVAARSKLAIRGMRIDKEVEVRELSEEHAFALLKKICGPMICGEVIKSIAKMIIKSCGRLPHAIIMVAEYLKGKNDKDIWAGVKTRLQSDSNLEFLELGGVIKAYELVYDELQENHVKMCFLYGALFPSEHKIYKDYLIECWKSEGVFKNKKYINSLRDGRHEGACVLNELTSRFVLEFCTDKHVKMPIFFRKVALARNYPDEENSIIWVAESKNELPEEESWGARRISSIGQLSAEEILLCTTCELTSPISPSCPNISTLLLQKNPRIQKLDDCFFQRMKSLQVLDLHRTPIQSLPTSISCLENLVSLYVNGCSHLAVLPSEVEKLSKLEILDIRGTSITPWLPEHIRNVTSLRCLRVSFGHKKCSGSRKGKEIMATAPDIITNLTHLEELVIETDSFSSDDIIMSTEMVDVLVKFKHLTTLHFNFPNAKSYENFTHHINSWKKKSTEVGDNTFQFSRFFVGGNEMSTQFDSDICGILVARHSRFSCTNGETSSPALDVIDQS